MSKERNFSSDDLFPNNDQEFGEKYTEYLLQLYQLYVETADKVSERRSFANTFFLSLNSFLLVVIGVVPQLKPEFGILAVAWVAVVSVVGILFSVTWIKIINSYAKLNEAKFTVIGELEKKLPASVFAAEWKFLVRKSAKKPEPNRRVKYFPLTLVESRVPKICIILYIILAAVGISTIICQILKSFQVL